MSRRPSPLDNEQCRQCSSFSDYMKSTKKKVENEETKIEKIPRRTDCPLDKDELGNKTWGLLHSIAATYPDKPLECEQSDVKQFFGTFARLYPCPHCREDFKEELKADPPKTESQEALSQWLCRMHNKINVKLEKEEFDCSKVNERWRDGWLDGSCD